MVPDVSTVLVARGSEVTTLSVPGSRWAGPLSSSPLTSLSRSVSGGSDGTSLSISSSRILLGSQDAALRVESSTSIELEDSAR